RQLVQLFGELVAVALLAVELRQRETECWAGPRIVTSQAFRAAEEMPVGNAFAARRLRIEDRQRAIAAFRGDECCVGLLVVPLIGVAVPASAVVVEDLRFQPAAALGLTTFQLE